MRSMHANVLASFAAVLAACGGGAKQTSIPASPARYSIDADFVEHVRDRTLGDYGSGTVYVFDDAIKLVVRDAVMPFVGDQRVRLVALSAGLGYGDMGRRSNVRRESRKVFVSDMRTQGDTLRDSVTFWIQGTRGIELTKHYMILIRHVSVFGRERGTWSEETRPIFSDLQLFRRASAFARP